MTKEPKKKRKRSTKEGKTSLKTNKKGRKDADILSCPRTLAVGSERRPR